MTSSQLDVNKFNSFLDAATQAVSCGPECMQAQTAEELKNKYLNAQSQLTLAKPQYVQAKQNYYTYVSGENGYNEMLQSDLTNQVAKLAQSIHLEFITDVSNVSTNIAVYNGLLINMQNVEELHTKYTSENKMLFKQYKNTSNDILTNERKTFYEDQEIHQLKMYYTRILWVIYIASLICFFIFAIYYNYNYNSSNRVYITAALLIVLPFISTYLMSTCIRLYYLLLGIFPKNVYV